MSSRAEPGRRARRRIPGKTLPRLPGPLHRHLDPGRSQEANSLQPFELLLPEWKHLPRPLRPAVFVAECERLEPGVCVVRCRFQPEIDGVRILSITGRPFVGGSGSALHFQLGFDPREGPCRTAAPYEHLVHARKHPRVGPRPESVYAFSVDRSGAEFQVRVEGGTPPRRCTKSRL
jgi:hypothetical protein